MSFQAPEKGFTLVTLHVIYGTKSTPEVRTPEIARFAQWLRENAEDPDEFNATWLRSAISTSTSSTTPTGGRSW